MARMATAAPRRARFTETRRYAALNSTLESRGWLAFENGRLTKMTDWPDPERLEVDGQRIVITQGNEPPRVIDMAMAPPLRLLVDAIRGPLSGDIEALRRSFAPTLTGTLPAWSLHLTPHTPGPLPGPLRDIHLTGRSSDITTITLTQANGDEQSMAISPP